MSGYNRMQIYVVFDPIDHCFNFNIHQDFGSLILARTQGSKRMNDPISKSRYTLELPLSGGNCLQHLNKYS